MTSEREIRDADGNHDPISPAPDSDPVGTGIGVGVGAVLGGAAVGAATGTVAGPVGTAVGAAVGALIGGLAGKGVAESVDPVLEDAYWRDNYGGRSYVTSGASYADYGPAFGYGVYAFGRYPGRGFDDIEDDLSREWDSGRGESRLSWAEARQAARDAWDRVDGSGRHPA